VLLHLYYETATHAGIPKYLLHRLQLVLNAAACLVCHACKYDHVSLLLQELHLLSVLERIKYRLAVLVFCCRHKLACAYLVKDLQWTGDTDSRQRLRSSSSQQLVVLRTRLHTVDCASGAAAAPTWNNLSVTVTSAAAVNSFKKHLKIHFFNCFCLLVTFSFHFSVSDCYHVLAVFINLWLAKAPLNPNLRNLAFTLITGPPTNSVGGSD